MEAAVIKSLRVFLGALVALVLVSACQRPLIPSSLQGAGGAAKQHSGSVRTPRSSPRMGVDLYVKLNYMTNQVRKWGTRDIRYIMRDLHATNISISWNLFAPYHHSNQVLAVGQVTKTGSAATGKVQLGSSLTPRKLSLLTRIAEQAGATVEYRPLVKIQGPSQWSGYIAPYNVTTWFHNYFLAELPYLRVAQRLHVREFIVGTELADLEVVASKRQWEAFVQAVRSVYSGKISYTAWEGHYSMASKRALPPIRPLGLAAYPDFALKTVSCPANPSVKQLVDQWVAQFNAVPLALRNRTTITELGIPSGCGAWRTPWNWDKSYPPDQTAQARWFTSACTAVRRLGFVGIYFWNVNLADDPYHPPNSLTSFEGKRGARAIRECANMFASSG